MRTRGCSRIRVLAPPFAHSQPWIYALGAERRTAATGAAGARVVEAKPCVVQAFDIVERGAGNIRKRDLIDEDIDAVEYGQDVAFLLAVEAERILEAGASAADDRDSKSLVGRESFFSDHLAHCFERLGREIHAGQF